MAGPLREGGGGKGPDIKEKITYKKPFKFFIQKWKWFYLSKYESITLKFVGRYFIWVVTIYSKK